MRYAHYIDAYTFTYNEKCRPSARIRAGQYVEIYYSPDDREYDEFHCAMQRQGLKADHFVRSHPRKKTYIWLIEKI